MPDRDLSIDLNWMRPVRHVQDAVVLDVRPRADADRMDVATQHGAVPDRAVVAEDDVADQRGIFGDENTVAEARRMAVIGPGNHGRGL